MNIRKYAAAAVLAGFLGFGGVSLASAQESPTTTTPAPEGTTPSTEGGTHADNANCPNMGGSSDSTGSAPAAASSL